MGLFGRKQCSYYQERLNLMHVKFLYAVKVRRHKPWSHVRCHGCRFTHSQFHSRQHSLRITLKYTTLVQMRSGYAWTMKQWKRSEWRLGLTAYSHPMNFSAQPCAAGLHKMVLIIIGTVIKQKYIVLSSLIPELDLTYCLPLSLRHYL